MRKQSTNHNDKQGLSRLYNGVLPPLRTSLQKTERQHLPVTSPSHCLHSADHAYEGPTAPPPEKPVQPNRHAP
jgi:hypothetical protein